MAMVLGLLLTELEFGQLDWVTTTIVTYQGWHGVVSVLEGSIILRDWIEEVGKSEEMYVRSRIVSEFYS